MKKSILFILTICLTLTITNINNVYAYEEVTDRDLALASALTYVPSFCTDYRIKKGKCTLPNSESSPSRKVINFFNSYVNVHNYGKSDELKDWIVVDYTSESTSKLNAKLTMKFNAFTLKNDKNKSVMIVYRGTDFVDALEWVQHLTYGLHNVHEQETHAEKYILEQAAKYKDYKIYITGHSLGGYLADVASATLLNAIENGKNGTSNWKGFNLYTKLNGSKVYNINNFNMNDYKNINFVRSTSFNGMGFLFDVSTKNIDNNVQKEKINIIKKYKDKVIDYAINGDVVSSLGLRVGSIKILDAPLDSVSFHRSNYELLFGKFYKLRDIGLDKIDNNPLISYIKEEAKDYTSARAKAMTGLLGAFELSSINPLDRYLRNDIFKTYKYYDMNDIVPYVHLTHETDGFVCLLNNKALDNTKLRVYNYKNILLNHLDYVKKEDNGVLAFDNNKGKTLMAITSNACARNYEWYSCSDSSGKNCTLIQTNGLKSDNKDNKLKITPSNDIKYYKVKSLINDNYREATIVTNGTNLKYQESETEINQKSKQLEKVFGVVIDKKAPQCRINVSKFSKKKDCDQKLIITCTDDVGLQNNKITLDNISGNLKDKLNIVISDNERISNEKSTTIELDLTPKKITIGYKKLNITISDIAGNKTTVTVKGNINSNLFNKKCS